MVLLVLLLQTSRGIQRSVEGLLEIAGQVGENTANIPQLEATAPVLALIVDEAVVQDGYMNALTDGFGEAVSTDTLTSQRPARGRRRRRARPGADPGPPRPVAISTGLATLAPRWRASSPSTCARSSRAVKAINAQFDVILGALPEIARKAAIVAERRPR